MPTRLDKLHLTRIALLFLLIGVALVAWTGLAQTLSGDWTTDDGSVYEDAPAESTEEGLKFETPFMIDISHLLLGMVTDCDTGVEIESGFLHTSFVFVPGAMSPYQLHDLVAITVECPGYFPIEITEFQPLTFSVLFFDITVLTVTAPQICLQPFLNLGFTDVVLLGSIEWQQTRSLTWEDFKGTPETDAAEDAEILSGLSFDDWRTDPATRDAETGQYTIKIQSASLVVRNVMVQTGSWVVAGAKTDALLNHEQRHFDLNEVYRRKLRTALLQLRGKGRTPKEALEDLQRQIKETWDKANAKLKELQDQYDRETDHGRKGTEQGEWDKKIDGWLKDPTKAPDW